MELVLTLQMNGSLLEGGCMQVGAVHAAAQEAYSVMRKGTEAYGSCISWLSMNVGHGVGIKHDSNFLERCAFFWYYPKIFLHVTLVDLWRYAAIMLPPRRDIEKIVSFSDAHLLYN